VLGDDLIPCGVVVCTVGEDLRNDCKHHQIINTDLIASLRDRETAPAVSQCVLWPMPTGLGVNSVEPVESLLGLIFLERNESDRPTTSECNQRQDVQTILKKSI